MESWPIWTYIPFFVIPVVVGCTLVLLIRSAMKLDIEKGRTPVYHERCGGRFGMPASGETGLFSHGFFTFPFVRLSMYEDFVVISYSVQIVLAYSEIDNVEVREGLHLHHHTPEKQTVVLFGDTARIVEAFERYLPPGTLGSVPKYQECACGW
jgi:hypothetical protein